ncbi:MAG: DUF1731 domain-containing protein [Acidovorax sp.]|uniref:DUF1731 domain-containing protein n=1 Tax=Acidovorax sp. TaxID=1872122 RepID=UPI0039199785
MRLRFGVVLAHSGGAYPMQALAARLGLGAVLGHGHQPAPWIHLALDGQNTVPTAALTHGFPFVHPQLGGALVDLAQAEVTQSAPALQNMGQNRL